MNERRQVTAQIVRQEQLVRVIKPILARNPQGVQGTALMELLALFIAGHHPSLREVALNTHIEVVRQMVPICEAELFPHGKPWD